MWRSFPAEEVAVCRPCSSPGRSEGFVRPACCRRAYRRVCGSAWVGVAVQEGVWQCMRVQKCRRGCGSAWGCRSAGGGVAVHGWVQKCMMGRCRREVAVHEQSSE